MGLNAGGLCASLMPLQLKSYISSVTRNAILQSYPMFPSTLKGSSGHDAFTTVQPR